MDTPVSPNLVQLVADRRVRIRYLTGNGGGGHGALKMHDFAARSGLSVSFLCKFVRGVLPNPTLATLVRIDTALEALEGDEAVMRAVEAVHAKHRAQMATPPIDQDSIPST